MRLIRRLSLFRMHHVKFFFQATNRKKNPDRSEDSQLELQPDDLQRILRLMENEPEMIHIKKQHDYVQFDNKKSGFVQS